MTRTVEAPRRTRVQGEESRQRILDAATEIAGERGYGGTSIALVSERCGLPASSIYWHFEDKDELIAAVIERSFNRWLDGIGAWAPQRDGTTRLELLAATLRCAGKAMVEAPDFLRLGLMLALERRPREATARTLFLQVRAEALKRTIASYGTHFDDRLDADAVRALAVLTMSATDGLFIAHELDPEGVDLDAAFELLAAAILGAADHLASGAPRKKGPKR